MLFFNIFEGNCKIKVNLVNSSGVLNNIKGDIIFCMLFFRLFNLRVF